jgi:DNA-binding transcriptional regulator YiaG
MSTNLFCMRGDTPAAEPRLYEACGLDNIWLVDGFQIIEHHGEQLILPEDVEGLHRAIALHLAMFRKPLAGREIRFIRRAIDMTQAEFAHSLGVTSQTVARWEKDQVGIRSPEERLLRFTAILVASDKDRLADLLSGMPHNLEELDEGPDRPVSFTHATFWKEAA